MSGNGFCYKLVKSATTFEESEARCRSLDAYLVKIETQMENNFLSNMLMAERGTLNVFSIYMYYDNDAVSCFDGRPT